MKDGEPWAKFTGKGAVHGCCFLQGDDHCGHLLNPARRVCCDGYDYGRRFLVCPREDSQAHNFCSKRNGRMCSECGFETCAYLKWVDKEWHGRPREVIGKLAEENLALQKCVFNKDAEIMRMKEERKGMNMKHKKEIKARASRELCIVCLFCSSVWCCSSHDKGLV
ncbi:hypothetical protein ZWY2020_036295 [Hordeum vulgare]|nr:hypothetical protein ZWY2020_036295 [Hordeum vulgare]